MSTTDNAVNIQADDGASVVLPFDKDRTFLHVVGGATITVDGVVFITTQDFTPSPAPMNAITIAGATVVLYS